MKELKRQLKAASRKHFLLLQDRMVRRWHTDQIRALPQSVEIREHFRYTQKYGHLRPSDGSARGAGEIILLTAGTDPRSFSAEAKGDAGRFVQTSAKSHDAKGAFLAFSNHSQTDFEGILASRLGYDSVPLAVPLARPELNYEDHLKSGLLDIHETVHYSILQPSALPLQCRARIFENQEHTFHGLGHAIYIDFDIVLQTPDHSHPAVHPRIDRFAIDWPCIAASNESLIGALVSSPRHEGVILDFQYDAATSQFTTRRVPQGAWRIGTSSVQRTRQHLTSIRVAPRRPVQLSDLHSITAEIRLVLDDYLLSGLGCDLFDAQGTYVGSEVPMKRKTVLEIDVTIDLDEAMERRNVTQVHRLEINGVEASSSSFEIMDRVFQSCGYQKSEDSSTDNERRLLLTKNAEGKTLELEVEVSGTRRSIHRTMVSNAGPMLKERLDAGDLSITLSGSMESDHRVLGYEMALAHWRLRAELASIVKA